MNEKKPFDWNRLLQAFTDENAAFNFPIKYPAIDLDKSTKNTLVTTALIISGGLIAAAYVFNKKRK